ncbi:hypothetical protein [Marivirga sp.]|uniref:hypothetical protein n=1 Tax=Marivirga sp. TaxID=2018662 RepID=UPI0025E6178F|nr:hypothetical protein [Marivirga sp.]
MKSRIIFLFTFLLIYSCSPGPRSFTNYNESAELQNRLAYINSLPSTLKRDSIFKSLEQAALAIPSDICSKGLIIKAFDLQGYLDYLEVKIHITVDSTRYLKMKANDELIATSDDLSFIHKELKRGVRFMPNIKDKRVEPYGYLSLNHKEFERKFEGKYVIREDYSGLSKNNFRYVLFSIHKLEDQDDEMALRQDGTITGWFARRGFYIYDRVTGEYFNLFYDLKELYQACES